MAEKKTSTKTSDSPETDSASAQTAGGRYTAVRLPLRHPQTGALFHPGRVTEALELDNWLKTQIQAGLIKEA